jgi:hypothetical protein
MIRHIRGWDRAMGSRREMTTDYETKKNTRQQDRTVESRKANEGERGEQENETEQGKTTRRQGNGGQSRKGMRVWDRLRRGSQERIE